MLFVIDLETQYVIEAASDKRPVSSVSGKRGDDALFEVQFVRRGVTEQLAEDTVLTFGAKQSGKYDSTPVVLHSDFVLSGSGETALYSGNPSFNTVPLNTLLFLDGDDSNDPEFVDLMAEFTWQVGAGAPTTTKNFRFRVFNDIIRDEEVLPATHAPLWSAPLALTAPPTDCQTSVLYFTGLDEFESSISWDRTDDVNGRGKWEGDGAAAESVEWEGSRWEVWQNSTLVCHSDEDVEFPSQVVSWTIDEEGFTLPVFGFGGSGTAATALGQLAIVTTTNDSGTFRDVWTCARVNPVVWEPPGNIFRDRSDGKIYRQFTDSGIPQLEEAYP